jgi:hypothetical protein
MQEPKIKSIHFGKGVLPMAQALRKPDIAPSVGEAVPVPSVTPQQMRPLNYSYRLLQAGYVAAPLIAGGDKFFNGLTDWTQYLAPEFPRMLGVTPQTFMYGVGVVEIAAGIGMIFKPKIFGFVVSGWLLGIIGNLLVKGRYYDIALRDLGLSIGAASLGLISMYVEKMRQSKL